MKTTAIKVEGQIISPEIFDNLNSGEIKGQSSKDYGFDAKVKVKEEIQRAWANAKDQWKIFKRYIEPLTEEESGTTETRRYWIIPLLSFLGYNVTVSRAEIVNENSYAISHRDMSIDGFPIHIVSFNDSLDKKRETGGPRLSPHALVQEYLNLTEHLYGFVTNGYKLRLLRDSGKLVRLTFIEFDLQKMMEEDLYAEFSILYRLLHITRMPQKMSEGDISLIEQYHQDSLEAGARIREKLSGAVEESIKVLGNGFLSNPKNQELIELIKSGQMSANGFYQHLLRLVYRILFLMVLEERDIVYPNDDGNGNTKYYKDLYYEYYSLQRLRRLSEKIFFFDEKLFDLWISLRNTFKIFGSENIAAKIKLYPLDGDLFDYSSLGVLSDSDIDNRTLLQCIKNLSQFDDKDTKSIIRVNYSALNVEEFGSVYEGLLEKAPVINFDGQYYSFSFIEGTERSSSGSHYTPEELVQPLIKHSLDYVIEDKLTLAKKLANSEWRIVNGEWKIVNDKLLADGKNSNLIGNINFNINEVIKNEFISRFGSLEKSYGNSDDGLQTNSSISERGNVRIDLSNPESSEFDSGKFSGRLGETGNKGISSIHPDSDRQSEGIRNSSSIDSESGNLYSSSDRTDSGTMRNSEQTNVEFTEESYSQTEINNWWINLPSSTRYSLLANRFLLSIKVCDVACGSGHILLSAARRIAQELTKVRTGEDQPSPEPFRQAIRDVINHCIYGVDKNPLAVELCKVALWLEAHNPGMPLNFLDHKIKCGDSIVGLARIEELQNGVATEAFKTLPGDDKDIAATYRKQNKTDISNRSQYTLTDKAKVIEKLNKISVKFKSFNSLPDNTVEAVKKKAEEFDVLRGEDWWSLKQVADLQVAQFFIPKTPENKDFLVTDKAYFRIFAGERAKHERQISTARAVAAEKKFFHWFLEFPEVMQEGGFDCILGNPPFLGGRLVSGSMGDTYLNALRFLFPSVKGQSDLVSYFFNRTFSLIRKFGFQALIATKTISVGDAREGSLEYILRQGGEINFAIRSIRWPGVANLDVSLLSISKGKFEKTKLLDKKLVEHISAFLDSDQLKVPYELKINNEKSFKGSDIFGLGFTLTEQEVNELIRIDSKNREVLYPYIVGDDLNNSPDTKYSRWVINFFNWELEKVEEFKEPFNIVSNKVKPQREKANRREKWWHYSRNRPALYRTIKLNKKVLAVSQIGKYFAFCFLPNGWVYSQNMIIFPFERYKEFALMQNTFHFDWGIKFGASFGATPIYTPTDCFCNFPFPINLNNETESELENIGEEYHEFRRQLMLDMQLGLTKTYNLFHNPQCSMHNVQLAKDIREFKQAKLQIPIEEAIQRIEKLRALHKQMDEAVLKAYGWGEVENSEQKTASGEQKIANGEKPIANRQSPISPKSPIALQHDFYEVDYLPENDRVRYTISPEARKEILKRLLELNHKIHAEEVAKGLWDKKTKKKKETSKLKEPKTNYGQEEMFGEETS